MAGMKFALVLIAVINGQLDVRDTGREFDTLQECHDTRAIYIMLKPPAWEMIGICVGIERQDLPPMS